MVYLRNDTQPSLQCYRHNLTCYSCLCSSRLKCLFDNDGWPTYNLKKDMYRLCFPYTFNILSSVNTEKLLSTGGKSHGSYQSVLKFHGSKAVNACCLFAVPRDFNCVASRGLATHNLPLGAPQVVPVRASW